MSELILNDYQTDPILKVIPPQDFERLIHHHKALFHLFFRHQVELVVDLSYQLCIYTYGKLLE